MNLSILRRIRVAALLAGALGAPLPAFAADTAPPVDPGLVQVEVRNVDTVYRRPGVNWAGYTKVLIAPATVSFSKSWDPRDYGAFGLSAADVDRRHHSFGTPP